MLSWKVFATLAVAVITSACASYEPSSAVVPSKSEFTLVGGDGVFVGANPYADPKEQEAMFDADLDKSDVIALQVFIENRRESAVLVRPSDAALTLPDGRALAPSGATKVATKVGEEGSVIGAGIAFGIIGVLAASSAEDKARTARIDDYESKALASSELRRGDTATGVVFFLPPKSWPAFDVAELSLRSIDPQTGQSWVIPVPLTGLSYEPGEPKK
ncbi:MAG TPA: hypothetical protein VLA52_17900 [Thermohalobaculum sp.]|nr:hypothetical protein [Thermohalobaculum sp.]